MPELPEVETIKAALEKAVNNSNITNVIVNNNRFRELIPNDFAKRIVDSKIISLYRVAKYIVINLNNGQSIIWHLGMSGKVKICESTPEELEKHDHVVIETSKGTLIYNDARRFGLLTCCQTEELKEHHLFKKMGIDPFAEELDGLYFYNKLKNKKIPIKVALLDQAIVNGIGNIYASEALYMAGIMPDRLASDISLNECKALLQSVREVLQKAIKAGGSTLRDYRKPDGSMGYFQNMHCVYNKTGQKCPQCTCDIKVTGGIKKIVQAGRSTFYCSTKQK